MFSENLNAQQLSAVRHDEGPILVVAGAGSGKTRVITCRIARLIKEKGVAPESILAITFTNKAAREMRDRVTSMLGGGGSSPWIGTFHSFCLRILRTHIDSLGFSKNFVIYDSQDQLSLIKLCMKSANMSEDSFSPKTLLNHISNFKNDFLQPEDVDQEALSYGARLKAAQLYPAYQSELKKNNGVDFDDLLMLAVRLLRENQNAADFYNRRYQYLMVDEFQDTNLAQYHLIRLLCQERSNVCAVGDDDQSIYRWRGANLDNILNFEKDFSGTRVVKLEENYRSTQNILKAAGAVVRENIDRKEKTLWTQNEVGALVVYCRTENDVDEAQTVCEKISTAQREEGDSFSDTAILYRTNAQSRVVEDELRKMNIPYQVVGGQRFYERREIKDVLAYMRVVANPADSVSLRRIVNVPPRGIGKTTMEKVESYCKQHGISFLDGLRKAGTTGFVGSSAGKKIGVFVALMDELTQLCETATIQEFLDRLLDRAGYIKMLEKEGTQDKMREGRARLENIQELYTAVEQFVERDQRGTLGDYLDSATLSADIDSMDDSRGLVSLMTLHTCKGLEFQSVFIIGMENNLLPHASSMGEREEYEEERRLCYVGFTRARKNLCLTNARQRRIYGSFFNYQPSDFLLAIPPETLVKESGVVIPDYAPPPRDVYSRPFSPSAPARFTAPSDDGEFPVGTKVVHPKFGRGSVINREGEGDSLRVVVYFQKAGKKTLAPGLAKLIAL